MHAFKIGTVYEDGRLDMCKFPVWPSHAQALMPCLDTNEQVRHFVVGNNLMGHVGATSIAAFVRAHPLRMETWYVAGNCLDAHGLRLLAAAWAASPVITNLWLKRNPLGPAALPALREILTHVTKLRTLDLDQTELGDDAVRQLFLFLAEKSTAANSDGPLALKNLYLNANGIGAIAAYLGSPACGLESLYLSSNPLGTRGVLALCNISNDDDDDDNGPSTTTSSRSLAHNRSLVRLCLPSCGLTNASVVPLLQALTRHPTLTYLDLGQSYATTDLGARYNVLSGSSPSSDPLLATLTAFIARTPTLHFLNLGTTALAHSALETLSHAVRASSSILAYVARSALPSLKSDTLQRRVRERKLREHLWANVRRRWGAIFGSYEEWEAEELRWVRSPRDVRLIDSVSRNREAGVARRGGGGWRKGWEGEGEGGVGEGEERRDAGRVGYMGCGDGGLCWMCMAGCLYTRLMLTRWVDSRAQNQK
ncbi:hypothetical protein MMC34_005010 [Xylographa carneopallida]|nr:hypothetical protein [Xylographa carneopallida]